MSFLRINVGINNRFDLLSGSCQQLALRANDNAPAIPEPLGTRSELRLEWEGVRDIGGR